MARQDDVRLMSGLDHGRTGAVVVGIRKSLESGKVYTYAELADRFGMRAADFAGMFDRLLDAGHLTPARTIFVSSPFEEDLAWRATAG